jgi:hypothetical protein
MILKQIKINCPYNIEIRPSAHFRQSTNILPHFSCSISHGILISEFLQIRNITKSCRVQSSEFQYRELRESPRFRRKLPPPFSEFQSKLSTKPGETGRQTPSETSGSFLTIRRYYMPCEPQIQNYCVPFYNMHLLVIVSKIRKLD